MKRSRNKPRRILAIDPGIRGMGIAFLYGDELIYHGVKTIERGSSSWETLKAGRKLILRLIADFRPRLLVIEKAQFGYSEKASQLNALVQQLIAIGKRKRLEVICYAPSTVKKSVAGNGSATKKEVSRAVVARYPELKAYLAPDRKWKEAYHANMFDAVAVGMTFLGNKRRAKKSV